MSTLNLLHRGRFGFESRILGRRAHRFDLQPEPLEGRRLLSTGYVGAAGGTVTNPTTAAQTNLPTDNSSTINTPSVSPMTPAPLNVETDDSASVITSATAAISVLNPDMTSALDTASDEPVVYLVETPVPPTTVELTIDTPGLLQSIDSPLTLQSINAPASLQSINSPVTLHAINAPVGLQPNNNPMPASNGPTTSIQHIGQGFQTELPKPLDVHVGPEPEETLLIEGLKPLQPFQSPKTERPQTAPPKIELPKADLPIERAPPVKQTPPAQDVPPVRLPPMPQPADATMVPRAPGAVALQAVAPGINAHTTPTALFGVTAVIGGGYYLAMRESERFWMPWLPPRCPSARPPRPRMTVR
jgi:hypothetical protein